MESILLTMGGMRAQIDDVRFMANESSGELGLEFLKELTKKKICATVICGWTASEVHNQIKDHKVFYTPSFNEMKSTLLSLSSSFEWGIFMAAVLDYLPEPVEGKIDSSQKTITLTLHKTEKLIDLFREKSPQTKIIGFKLEAGCTPERLIQKALQSHANRRPEWIVANRKEDVSSLDYKAHLLGPLTQYSSAELLQSAIPQEVIFGRNMLAKRLAQIVSVNS